MWDLGGEAGGVLDAPGANSRGHDGRFDKEHRERLASQSTEPNLRGCGGRRFRECETRRCSGCRDGGKWCHEIFPEA